MSMRKGDHFQHPQIYPFIVPEFYSYFDEDIRKNLFWEKIMQPNQPFKFAEEKMLHIMPICWTNVPKLLSMNTGMPIETIEETQKTLLYQSLLNSVPVVPSFLKEYEQELVLTAQYKRNFEKTEILLETEKTGSVEFTVELDASLITDEDDADANTTGDTQHDEHVKTLKTELKKNKSIGSKAATGIGIAIGLVAGGLALPLVVPLIPALGAYSVAAIIAARIGGGAVGSAASGGACYAINKLVNSDYWFERTVRKTYTAPDGHVI
jgi:hypothetical protein